MANTRIDAAFMFQLISLLVVYRVIAYFTPFNSFLIESFLLSILSLFTYWSRPLAFKTFVHLVRARASEVRRRSHPFLDTTKKLFMEVVSVHVKKSQYQFILSLFFPIFLCFAAILSFSLSLPRIYFRKACWLTSLPIICTVAILSDNGGRSRSEVKENLCLMLILLLSEVLHDAFFLFLCYAIYFGFAEVSLRHAGALLGHNDVGMRDDDGHGVNGDVAVRDADSDGSDASSLEIISMEDVTSLV